MLNISKWVSKKDQDKLNTQILLFGDFNVKNLRYKGKEKYLSCFSD